MSIQIRRMQPADEAVVKDICFVTSDWGKHQQENVRELVALRWCSHYIHHETEHCHVAVDTEQNKVVGYLLCAPNTFQQEARFRTDTLPALNAEIKRLQPKPGLDRFKLRKEFQFIATHWLGGNVKRILQQYPAHIHIDIYPSHHRLGIGRKLFAAHETHLRDIQVSGYHLIVGSSNETAVQFYQSMEMTEATHVGGKLNFGIVFVKKILEAE